MQRARGDGLVVSDAGAHGVLRLSHFQALGVESSGVGGLLGVGDRGAGREVWLGGDSLFGGCEIGLCLCAVRMDGADLWSLRRGVAGELWRTRRRG